MSKVSFIYFDVGKVLMRFSDGLSKVAEENGISYEDFKIVFHKYDKDACLGRITPQELWNIYKAELCLKSDIDDYVEFWTDHCRPIQEMHDFVIQIAKKVKVGLFSNQYLNLFPILLRKELVPSVQYNQVVLSYKEGYTKNDIEFFKIAQEKTGVDASKVLFIDDVQEYLDRGASMGWKTVLFDEKDVEGSIYKIEQMLKQ